MTNRKHACEPSPSPKMVSTVFLWPMPTVFTLSNTLLCDVLSNAWCIHTSPFMFFGISFCSLCGLVLLWRVLYCRLQVDVCSDVNTTTWCYGSVRRRSLQPLVLQLCTLLQSPRVGVMVVYAAAVSSPWCCYCVRCCSLQSWKSKIENRKSPALIPTTARPVSAPSLIGRALALERESEMSVQPVRTALSYSRHGVPTGP